MKRNLPGVDALALKRKWWTLLIIPVMFGLGMLLSSFQYSSDGEKPASQDAQDRGVFGAVIGRLQDEQGVLRMSVERLEKEAQYYRQVVSLRRDSVGDLANDLRLQMIVAGMAPVKGPGVRMILDDSLRLATPGDPNLFIIHDYQLRDAVNLLWQAGAEAISINTERLVTTSSIYSSGGTIMVNTTRLSPPFVILVVGDPDAMMNLITQPSSLSTLKAQARAYGLVLNSAKLKEVLLPAFSGSYVARYLNVGETGK